MESELVGLLAVLAIVLAVVTLVGHGIWVFLAWLFRAASTTTAPVVNRQCLYCNRPTPADHAFCIWCQRSQEDETARKLADIKTAQRVAVRLRTEKLITAEQRAEWEGRLEEYRQRLLPPAPTPQPTPPAKPPVSQPVKPPPKPAVPSLRPELVAAAMQVERPAPEPVPAKPAREPAPPPAPAKPHKSLPEMLREFMEPHNIRWGELIGGLLFIIGAAALVITQWETLERFRYFRFLAFTATTASVFGVGLYAQYRWRLEATSRVLLTLATLLVPLNFLAMAGLAKDDPVLVTLGLDATSLAVFAVLITAGARVLVPGGWCWQTGSVLGLSAVTLLVARWFSPASVGWPLTLAGCLSTGIFAAGSGGYLWTASQGRRLTPTRALGIFSIVGCASFALLVVLGVLVYRGIRLETFSVVFDHLSIPLVLAAVPPLLAGLTVARRMADRTSLEPYRATGNWIALVAGLLMLTALGLAWPWPELMTGVGLFAAVTLAAAALAFELPALHAGAIIATAIAYLMGFYWSVGATAGVERPDMAHHLLRLLVSARTGTSLVGLVIALTGLAYGLSRAGRMAHSLAYAIGAGVLAVASLCVVSAAWPMDPWRAAIVFAVYALACLASCAHFRRPGLTYAGVTLLLASIGWALWGRVGTIDIQWAAAYAGTALALSLVAATLRVWARPPFHVQLPWWSSTSLTEAYRVPLAQMADFVATGALTLGVAMAWIDQPRIDHTPMPLLAVAALATHWLLTAWLERRPERTLLASIVVLVGLVHTLVFNYTDTVAHPWHMALLSHAGLAIAAAGGAAWVGSASRRSVRTRIRAVVVGPLVDTAIATSLLAAMLLVPLMDQSLAVSQGLLALALMWLALAVLRVSPVWMAMHQVALAAAIGFGVYSWHGQLPTDHWVATLLHVQHAIGAVLALLALGWVAVRIAVRNWPLAQHLLQPSLPMPDQLLKYVLVAVQLGVLIGYAGVSGYFTAGVWIVWGLLVATLLLSLWERFGDAELGTAVLLVASLACLVAGPISNTLFHVTLQWTLANACLAVAVASWTRRPLRRMLIAAKARLTFGPLGPALVRGLTLLLMALPVLVLSATNAVLPASVWQTPTDVPIALALCRLTPMTAQLVPLGLLLAAFLGHAVRDNSARYVFLAGLTVDWLVVLGQVVHYAGVPRYEAQAFGLVQWPTIAAALWGLAWLGAGRWFGLWRDPTSPWARQLFSLQAGLTYLGNVPLWLLGVSSLILVGSRAATTVAAVGSPVGWAAFLLAVAAGLARRMTDGRWASPHFCGAVGVATIGLLACTIQGRWPDTEWGCRALTLGWSGFACLVAGGAWWVAEAATLPGAKGVPQRLIDAASIWVRVSCLAPVLLAISKASAYGEQRWAVAAIAVASAAAATMALWRRNELWAFAAALSLNLATSIAVWHFHYRTSFPQWSIVLLQANALTSAAVALVWLAVGWRLYGQRGPSLETSPAVGQQVALPVLANLWLVGWFLFGMATDPWQWQTAAQQLSQPIGWLALLVTAVAAVWYTYRVAPERLSVILGGLAFGLSVLGAAARFDLQELGHCGPVYALLIALAMASLLMASATGLGRTLRIPVRNGDWPLLFPAADVCAWVTLFGTVAVAFALRWLAAAPPAPWIHAWTVLCVAVSVAMVAFWQQRPSYVWSSALLVILAGNLAWTAWGPWTLAGWIDANVVWLATAALAWLLVDVATARVPPLIVGKQAWRFTHLALRTGLSVLSVVMALSLAVQIIQPDDALLMAGFRLSEPIHALAWALLTTGVVLALWDRNARFALAGLYTVGLLALALTLGGRGLPWNALCVYGPPLLATFALAAALLACVLPRLGVLARVFHIPNHNDRWSSTWFSPTQVSLAVLAFALALWVALDFQFAAVAPDGLYGLPTRMCGAWTLALLLPVTWTMAAAASCAKLSFLPANEDRQGWQDLTLLSATLLPACTAWAGLRPDLGPPWLLRFMAMVPDLAAWVAVFGLLAPRLLAPANDWQPVARRVAAWLLVAAAPAVTLLIGLEVYYYVPTKTLPNLAIVAAGLGLAGLAAVCLGFALSGRDPLGVGQLGRPDWYVYATELLVALLGLHLRLTWPELFRLGIIERYGLLLAMALAFGLAGLAELFNRRRLAVLAQPLERTALVLPLLPMIAFWLLGPHPAAVWFLIAAFYGLMSILRRSFWLGVLAVAAANVGLWVVWHRMELGILQHPQLWLIPPALAALVAEYASHGRLRAEQAGAVRYVSLGVIYLSSSADMFIAGIGNSVLLPLVLLGLSVLGVLCGMALRIRSFLYLGATFLLVVIAALLKYVTIDLHQTWVVWLSMAVLGAALLAMFGVFEKRRNDVLAAVKRFKTWEQ